MVTQYNPTNPTKSLEYFHNEKTSSRRSKPIFEDMWKKLLYLRKYMPVKNITFCLIFNNMTVLLTKKDKNYFKQ